MPSDFAPDQADFYLGDPDAAFKTLRANDPVHWHEAGRFWCLTRHADICEVSRLPRIYSSAHGTQLFQIADHHSKTEHSVDTGAASIIQMDPPEHNRHRKLVMDIFTPRSIAALEGRIREIARDSLSRIERGKEVNFVDTVAVPLPMFVIAELLGVPSADYSDFKRWSDAMIEAGGGKIDEQLVGTLGELFAYFNEKIAELRANPKNDVISRLTQSEIDGEFLTDPEIVMFCMTLLVAGNETTRNLIAGGMRALFENPDQLDRLRSDPSLLPNAIEEMLRYVTPVRNFTRRVMQDTRLRGRELKKGQFVALFYGSANRDEEIFGEDSDHFDITRTNARRHIAFGFGEHLCLGASLARLEARVLFEELFAMHPNPRLAGTPRLLPSSLMHGLVDMPVVFED